MMQFHSAELDGTATKNAVFLPAKKKKNKKNASGDGQTTRSSAYLAS
ncbi:hypothetical protein [Pseudoduganella albidiflava]|nr:hypothetical protein [Pseudoduganella albidiflava]